MSSGNPTACEVCRDPDMLDDVSWWWVGTDMLCPDHTLQAEAKLTEAALRSVIPKRQQSARELHDAVGVVPEWEGVYLYGLQGRGKSYQAAARLKRSYVRHTRKHGNPPSVMWYRTIDLLDDLRASYRSPLKTDNLLGRVQAADLLVLDDIGSERPTAWALERLLGIIGRRYDDDLRTDYTSMYDLNALPEQLRPVDEPDSSRGRAVASRIAETCHQHQMDGPDLRVEAAKQRRAGGDAAHTPGKNPE